MLTLLDANRRYNRREMLRVGAFGAGAFGVVNGFTNKAFAAARGLPITDKSVILLFLHGGPSQIETFDPKMTAPVGIQSVTGEIQTAIPGVTFGSSFPQMYNRADRLSIVRSFM